MTIRIIRNSAIGLVSLLVILTLWIYIFKPPSVVELGIKAEQYFQMNLVKNTGWRKVILQVATSFASLRPQYEYQQMEVGVSAKPGFDNNNSLIATRIRQRLLIAPTHFEIQNAEQLYSAFNKAKAGDVLLLSAGKYRINKPLTTRHSGSPEMPIILATLTPGSATLEINTQEGIYLTQAHWQILNLKFEGVCEQDQYCEHAIHLYGDADHTQVENNQFLDFNAAIKANGNYNHKPNRFADNVVILGNDFYNRRLRNTTNPASPIDVVGGNDWQLVDNFIADFARPVWHKPSVVYGAFFKGGGNRALISQNLINCAWKIPLQNALDVRVGLSLGDGGTQADFCQVEDCRYEHNQGKIQHNVIINCANDVSIYLNKAQNTEISDNILLNSLGIDARFPVTSLSAVNNTLQGRIKTRDSAFVNQRDNIKIN